MCDTTPGDQFDKVKPICRAVMSRREPLPLSWLFWHSLAPVGAGGAHSTNGRPLRWQTAQNKGRHAPWRLCPFPSTFSRLVFGWPLGIHALISTSNSQNSCWPGDDRISSHFHSLQPPEMGHSTKSCGGSGRRMWWTPLGWVHTQTCIPILRKSAWIQPESYCQQELRAEITQPASGHRSNGGAAVHGVGRYYSCSETKHSTNAGENYNTFNGELKRWFLPWASIIIFPLHEIRKDFRI